MLLPARPVGCVSATLSLLALAACAGEPLDAELRCSGCLAVASEIQHAVRAEGAHMDVVLGGRRTTKAVAWQLSELRTIEIFEGLCEVMETYFMMSHEGRRSWVKLNGREGDALVAGTVDVGSHKSQDERRELRRCVAAFASRLLRG